MLACHCRRHSGVMVHRVLKSFLVLLLFFSLVVLLFSFYIFLFDYKVQLCNLRRDSMSVSK